MHPIVLNDDRRAMNNAKTNREQQNHEEQDFLTAIPPLSFQNYSSGSKYL